MNDSVNEFLWACLRHDDTAAIASMSASSQDWECVLGVATDERLLPLLHSRINQLELGPRVPPDIIDFLSAVEALNQERNIRILNEVKFAGRLLNQVGIEPVLLKGVAYLAMGIYPDPATRYLIDIDILIPETQLQAAVETLVHNGFEADSNDHFGHF